MANLPAIISTRRPGKPDYTPEIAEEICERLMCGETLIEICEDPAMPAYRTVHHWLARFPSFGPMYAHAREVQAHHFADENIIIAKTPQMGEVITKKGDGTVEIRRGDMLGHRQLNIDTRKWYASKLNRRVYGNQAPKDGDGTDGGPSTDVSDEPPRV